LGSLLCCLIFPLIQIQSKIDVTSEVTTYVLNDLEVNITPASASWSLREIAFLVYTVIVALLIAPLLLNAFRLYSTISGSSGKRHASFYLIESNDNLPSWSFFKLIFIGGAQEMTNEDRDLIVKHEMLHGELYHSADMLFATLLCVVFGSTRLHGCIEEHSRRFMNSRSMRSLPIKMLQATPGCS